MSRSSTPPGTGRWGAALLALLALSGCELDELTLLEPPSLLVAEVYLRVNDGIPDAVALVHRSRRVGNPGDAEVIVEVKDSHGRTARLQPVPAATCMAGTPPQSLPFTCLRLTGKDAELIRPGARLLVEVTPATGGMLRGETVVPGDFRLRVPDSATTTCRMAPGQLLPVSWSRASGAWAYVPEVRIEGLKEAFAPLGLEVNSPVVTLQALAISEADTSAVLPSEFGVFSRFHGDQDLLLALRGGFPAGPVRGHVLVSAWDRNGVNWNRVGEFNPSGTPRSPSLRGEGGTGVVASAVNRSFHFAVSDSPAVAPCDPAGERRP